MFLNVFINIFNFLRSRKRSQKRHANVCRNFGRAVLGPITIGLGNG
jgi:hypothetical protein